MSTAVRHAFFVGPLASTPARAREGDRVQWMWLALVAALVASVLGLGMTHAVTHPNVAGGAPEMPVAGWGD